MNYNQAMAGKDVMEWQVDVDKEHDPKMDNDVWETVPKSSIPPRTKKLKSVCNEDKG